LRVEQGLKMEKSYKLVNNGSDKQIAYPIGMSDDLIAALEIARKNKSFVTLTSGNEKLVKHGETYTTQKE